MVPPELWGLIASYCARLQRGWLNMDYETCIRLKIPPCKLSLEPALLETLYKAVHARTSLHNEVFIYDAHRGKATYFGVYDYENYEFAVTTNTALTSPGCGEWIVWAGAEERITLVRDGHVQTHKSVVSKSYCFELGQLPSVVLWNGCSMSTESYWKPIMQLQKSTPCSLKF